MKVSLFSSTKPKNFFMGAGVDAMTAALRGTVEKGAMGIRWKFEMTRYLEIKRMSVNGKQGKGQGRGVRGVRSEVKLSKVRDNDR